MNFFKDKLVPMLKKHWLILVLGLVALAALPTAVFFSSSMNAKFVEEFQQQVNKDHDPISKSDNSYELIGVSGEKLYETKAAFNAERTQWYKDRWAEIQSKTGVVWEEGLKFNKGSHGLLIKEGVFPEPPALERDVRVRDFLRAVIEHHKKVLEQARAGSPPDAASVSAQLAEFRQAAVAKIQAEKGGEPDKVEGEKIAKDLLDQRVARYRSRAGEVGVYADMSVFEGIPAQVDMTSSKRIEEAWDLQERCWINSDIMRAVRTTNSESGVPNSTVKRVLRIAIDGGGLNKSGTGEVSELPFEQGDDKVPVDFSYSITGRKAGPGTKNKWYDIRYVTLEVIVSSQRLPALIDALAATNFISVFKVDLSSVDIHAELGKGFYYGDEHVVKATLRLETVWLREWRKDWMPSRVKRALAMDEGFKGDPNAPGGGYSPPPPSRGGGKSAGGGEEEGGGSRRGRGREPG